LAGIRQHLRPFYSEMERPSIDPELMLRMFIVSYCFGIRSGRPICNEVHPNLACRWFCRLGLEGGVPDHSSLFKNHRGRFRDSGLLRQLFEAAVKRCVAEGLVGGDGFAVDGSLIRADANRQHYHAGEEGLPSDFTYDTQADVYTSLAGKLLKRRLHWGLVAQCPRPGCLFVGKDNLVRIDTSETRDTLGMDDHR
jgi:transposase